VTCRPIARGRLGKQARNKYATNNRGRPVLGNGCVSMGPPQDYISSGEQNQIRERIRTERVLGSPGRRVRLKIYCELLQSIVITNDCKGVINKSNHPIQILFITLDHTSQQ
jgi:hypothetical protein